MSNRSSTNVPVEREVFPVFVDMRLVPSAVAVWCGCWWGTGGNLKLPVAVGVTVFAFMSAAFLILWRRYEDMSRPRPRHRLLPSGSLRLSLAVASIAAAGACLLAVQARSTYEADPFHAAYASRHTLDLDVEITGYPRPLNSGSSFSGKDVTLPAQTLRLHLEEGRTVASSVEVRIRGKGMMAFQRGDQLRVRVKPAAHQRLPPPVAAEMQLTRLVSREAAQGLAALPARIRSDTHVLLADMPAHTRGLIPGLAMGDRSALSRTLNEAMRVASLSHLSAISGMHIAVLLGAGAFIVPGRGVLRIAAIVCALVAILVIAGATPSVLRALTMAGIGAWGLLSRRSTQGLSALAIATTVMLYADPWNARSFGFALSIMATAGMVTHGKRWQEWAKNRLRHDTVAGRVARMIHALVSVPLAAQIWVVPVLIVMEPQVPLWGVVANVLISSIVAPLTILSLGVCLSAPLWPGLAEGLACCAEPLCAWVATVARYVASLPGAALPWPDGIDGAFLWYALLMTMGAGIKVVARVGHWRRKRSPALTTY